jgi:deoxyribonuclease V
MLACVDVDYQNDRAQAACVLFREWSDAQSAGTHLEVIPAVQPYQPGKFYLRELPCLLAVLAKVQEPLQTVVVDGYVWLQDEQSPGLGGHLHAALNLPVIGVAKTRYLRATAAKPVWRGNSQKPLYVTAAGMEVDQATRNVESMHGPFRVPTLLKLVDQLCRGSQLAER